MDIFHSFLKVMQVLSSVAVIVLVLLQHGKGADMGAAFGSGSSGSLFGASGSANFLSRLTAICATIFLACTLGLSFYGVPESSGSGGLGVLEGVSTSAVDDLVAPNAGDASELPGTESSPVDQIPK